MTTQFSLTWIIVFWIYQAVVGYSGVSACHCSWRGQESGWRRHPCQIFSRQMVTTHFLDISGISCCSILDEWELISSWLQLLLTGSKSRFLAEFPGKHKNFEKLVLFWTDYVWFTFVIIHPDSEVSLQAKHHKGISLSLWMWRVLIFKCHPCDLDDRNEQHAEMYCKDSLGKAFKRCQNEVLLSPSVNSPVFQCRCNKGQKSQKQSP